MTLQCCWDGMFQITIQLERSGSGGGSGSGGQRDVNWATHLLEKLGASPATGEFSHQDLPILFCFFSIDLFSSILYIYFSQNVCVFMFNFLSLFVFLLYFWLLSCFYKIVNWLYYKVVSSYVRKYSYIRIK